MTLTSLRLFFLAMTLALPAFGNQEPAASAPAGGRGSGDNVFQAGPTVTVSEPVGGDLFAAGGRVAVEQPVSQDAAVAGGDVAVRAAIGQDLRIAGGRVELAAPVGQDLHVAGGQVRLLPTTRVSGRAWIAAGDVQMQGQLLGNSKIHAGKVVISGTVTGDLHVTAESIELREGSRVTGRFTYVSPQGLKLETGAQMPEQARREPAPADQRAPRSPAVQVALAAVWLAGLLAAGVLWALLLPGIALPAQARLAGAVGPSAAIGAAVLILTPLVALMLAVTVVGIPLALALLAAYALMLLAGYLVAAGTIGQRLLKALRPSWQGTAQQISAMAAALVLLALVAAVPVLGWVVLLAVLMAGVGALASYRFAAGQSGAG